jgi:hypothetical protein
VNASVDEAKPEVKVVSRSDLARPKRRGSRGKKKKWYERQTVAQPLRGQAQRIVRKTTKVIKLHDLVRNNGNSDDTKSGQIGMIVSLDESNKLASVACSDGITDWHFREIDRISKGQRD